MKKIAVVILVFMAMTFVVGLAFSAETVKVVKPTTTVARAAEVTAPVAPVPTPSYIERMFTIGFVQDMIQIILLTALPLLFTGIGWLFFKLFNYLDKAADNIESDIGKKAAHTVINVMRGIVDRIGATQRKKLEAKLADGKITKEEFKEQMTDLGKDAIEQAKETVGIKTLAQAQKEIKDLTSHMANELESYVEQKKTNSSIILSPVVSTQPAANTTSTAKAA